MVSPVHDLRYAIRGVARTPGVTVAVLLSLALGIGANTAIFSLVNGLLLRTLPVQEPQRLAILLEDGKPTSWSNPIWEQIRDSDLFDGALAWEATRFDLSRGGESKPIDGIYASGRFFEILGVTPSLGRALTSADDRRGGGPDGPVAVISHGFWLRHFGEAPDVVGRTLTLGGVPYTVVGVAPHYFFGPDVGRTFDVIVPLATEALQHGADGALDSWATWWLNIIVRLRQDQPITAAQSALQARKAAIIAATLPSTASDDAREDYLKRPFSLGPAATGRSPLRDRYGRPLIALLVVVGLVLLIACANIANLMFARVTSRRQELSVRLALGARRSRLAADLLIESLLLASLGAAVGFVFAQSGSRFVVSQLTTQTNLVFLDLTPDWRVFAFTAVVATLTALLFGVAPAIRAASVDPIEALKEQGRSASSRRIGIASGLVVIQVALSLVLVVAAGLFVRTFAALTTLDLGFDTTSVMVVSVSAPRNHFQENELPLLNERLLEAARSAPGVGNVGGSMVVPIGGGWTTRVEVEDGPPLSPGDRGVHANAVSPGWFDAYGMKILGGRQFVATDRLGAERVAIVNEAFARHFLNGENPLGRVIIRSPNLERIPVQIVGLVRDAVYRSVRQTVPPTMYVPLAQYDEAISTLNIAVRPSTGNTSSRAARNVIDYVTKVDPNLVITSQPLADRVGASLIQERLMAMLSSFFGALAILLAGIGLYGVTSYGVSRRRAELGIRIALGATPGAVVRMVLRGITTFVLIGVALGSVIGLWASQFVKTLLFGLEPRDPLTFAGAAMLLICVALFAAWLPALRATRIDPMLALRAE
jgi:predicted permease